MLNSDNDIKNYLTIDVEDYFQVSAFDNIVKFKDWGSYESRIVNSTMKILDLLNNNGKFKATFFILGWLAERYGKLVKEIDANGHEIGCHSYQHKLVYKMQPDEFRYDTVKSKKILEDIIGKEVIGYRAPSYSITKKSLWALEILNEVGFKYDSSVFPIRHDRYGIPNTPRFRYKIPQCNLIEYPISTSMLFGIKIPISGGGYFRLFPYSVSKRALKHINVKEEKPFVFYLHPWEIDPQQPRIDGTKFFSQFRHYINLKKTNERFIRLLHDFKFTHISNGLVFD